MCKCKSSVSLALYLSGSLTCGSKHLFGQRLQLGIYFPCSWLRSPKAKECTFLSTSILPHPGLFLTPPFFNIICTGAACYIVLLSGCCINVRKQDMCPSIRWVRLDTVGHHVQSVSHCRKFYRHQAKFPRS